MKSNMSKKCHVLEEEKEGKLLKGCPFYHGALPGCFFSSYFIELMGRNENGCFWDVLIKPVYNWGRRKGETAWEVRAKGSSRFFPWS